jgi:hypothetical protein
VKVYVVMEGWEDYDSYQSNVIAAALSLDAAKRVAEQRSAANGIHGEITKKRADALRENDLLEHVVEYRNQRIWLLLDKAKREYQTNMANIAHQVTQAEVAPWRTFIYWRPPYAPQEPPVDIDAVKERVERELQAEYARYSAECDRLRAEVPYVPVPDELPFNWEGDEGESGGVVSHEWHLDSTPYHVYEVEVTA